jgi:hypothetical protein
MFRKKIFWLVILVIIISLFLRYFYDIFLFVSNPIKRLEILECKRLGGKWDKPYLMHPHTCLLKFSDGGKKCTSGSDCKAKICLINNYSPAQKDERGRYIGECPSSYIGNPFFYRQVGCGEAQIEDGTIVKDLRNEPCPIY